MGTLDEAIRQHLDLKRRSGADPGEVAKLEREAFGPIRREDALAVPPPAIAEVDPPAEPDAAPELFDAHVAEPTADAPLEVPFEPAAEPADAFVMPDAPYGEEPVEPAPAVEPPAQVEAFEEPVDAERPRAPAAPLPPIDAPPASRTPEGVVGERTVEFSALDHAEATESPAPAAETDEDGDPVDELEETPEFLEETPEHDRLWFEQKPPRDFDF